MTPEQLQAIRERAEKATPVPGPLPDDFVTHSRTDAILMVLDGSATDDDYELVYHARADVLALVAEVERLWAEVARLQSELQGEHDMGYQAQAEAHCRGSDYSADDMLRDAMGDAEYEEWVNGENDD